MLVHHKFICSVPDNPHFPAIKARDTIITRKQLNLWSNHISSYLLSKGIRGEVIPLVAPKSIGCIIGMLGILKAGCSYVLFHSESEKLREYRHILVSPRTPLKKQYSGKIHYMTNEVLQTEFGGFLIRPVRHTDVAYRTYTPNSIRDVQHKDIEHFFADWKQFYSNEDYFERSILDDDWNGYVLFCLNFGRTIVIPELEPKHSFSVDIIPFGAGFVDSIFVSRGEILGRSKTKYQLVNSDYQRMTYGIGKLMIEMDGEWHYTKLTCESDGTALFYRGELPLLSLVNGYLGHRFIL
jgi:hypothetical protein